ncbi:MAG TPA: Na/Pi cotransporter family protein [Spirochaetales bacterium]|nr:Na/Pi cotransporter family protein [Spirochaetales bacterium]HRY53776.1 Na/Pi cotransporter family protein [Spirochaetia bacterium]
MQLLAMVFELVGGLAMFMYGMELTSEGIQRAAGDRLQRVVNFMTMNRVVAVLTGALVTILIQSSSATSVMVVSFVNAGLLSLVQAIGVIMGANIGTTLTGWIIAAVGVQKFSIAAIAVPAFGIGFFMTVMKKRSDSFRSYGQALMGFAMIFLGLGFLSKAIPKPSGEFLYFLQNLSSRGFLSVIAAVLVGAVFTILVNASSATQAIVIALSAQGILDFRMAAAITLGANIGTTFDAFLASISPNANTNAKRSGWAHILFNVSGSLWVLLVFEPFLALVDLCVPGPITAASAGAHLAMFHTLFNTANTLVLLPFVRQYAALLERLFKERPEEAEARAKLSYLPIPLMDTPELSLLHARKELGDMAAVARSMFSRFRGDLKACPDDLAAEVEWFRRYETYADEMQEELATFLLEITRQDVREKTQANIAQLLRVVDELENVTDSCMSLSLLLERCDKKGLSLEKAELEAMAPYTLLVEEFLRFVGDQVGGPMDEASLQLAAEFEDRVDAFRKELKKIARKRLKAGADVKTELVFIDMVRHIEKIGDYAYSIAEALREMK